MIYSRHIRGSFNVLDLASPRINVAAVEIAECGAHY